MVEFRHYKYFLVVAGELNFTKAAKQLHIAQPALSQNIRQLEEELGVELLQRNSHSVELTNAGKLFYTEARKTMQQIEYSKLMAKIGANANKASLSLGYTPTSILSDLPFHLRKFRFRHPEIDIVTKEMTVDALVAAVRYGQLDVICVDSAVVDPYLETLAFSSKPMLVSLNRTHQLADSTERLPLSELASEIFCMPTPYKDYTLYDTQLRACLQAGFEPNVKYYADTAPGGVGLVAANLCVQMMHNLPLLRCPNEIVWREVCDPSVPLDMCLAWRKQYYPEYLQQFVQGR